LSSLKIHIASDHGGYELKQHLLSLKSEVFEFIDWGPESINSVDYPDYSFKVCQALQSSYEKQDPEIDALKTGVLGLLICGSGQGMCMSANKFSWIRGALCWDEKTAQLAREHNNANILCLGGRIISESLALDILKLFIETPFQGERHAVRVKKISQLLSRI